MKLCELVNMYEWKDLDYAMRVAFPSLESGQIEKYGKVYEELKGTEVVKNPYIICFELMEPENAKSWISVYGRLKGEGETYAIEYYPWGEWLGMEIDKETEKEWGSKNIICHCLWEMTYYGSTNEMVQKRSDRYGEGMI